MTKRNTTGEGPDPVDVYVGAQVAKRRQLLGYNQSDLGRALGLTFQQIQKYEKGSNRISASKLFAIAAFLGCAIGDLFPAQDGEVAAPPSSLETWLLVKLRRFVAPFAADAKFEVSDTASARLLTFAILAPAEPAQAERMTPNLRAERDFAAGSTAWNSEAGA